ncbi:TraB/GumN family protein [Citromicrobium bathyomarinum]|uniref:TraB/GumN family protein n=1 Tax=Citromicrobium bathyomarinum TaxID=72174 RepID=UPI00315B1CC4
MHFHRKSKFLASACAAFAIAATTVGCAPAQTMSTPVASTQAPASSVGIEGPALWRVADEDTTIYVFGTVHALPDDVNWYSGTVKNALDSSDTLVTEIDMTPAAKAETAALFQRTATLPAGTTLRSLLTEEQRTDYEALLTEFGMPVNALDTVEPWGAALALSQIAFARAGIDGENGTEKVLEEKIGDRLGRDALETAAFQLEIFDGLPQDAQIDYLMETVTEIDTVVPMLNQIIAEWAEGDVDDLGALLNEALEADPVLADRMLYSRNKTWAGWIDERLDSPGTIFMAVGAGHLAGNRSVQDYLAERGISMTRVQ